MYELRKVLECIKSIQEIIIEKEIVETLALSQEQLKQENLKNSDNILRR